MTDFKQLRAQRQARTASSNPISNVGQSDPISEVDDCRAPSQPSNPQSPTTQLNHHTLPTTSAQSASSTSASRSSTFHFDHLLDSSLRVDNLAHRGRGLVAAQPFKRGQTLISTKPVICVLDAANLSTRCSTCFKAATDKSDAAALLQCSICKTIHYCSQVCQRADWTAHKAECKAIVAYGNARPNLKGKRAVPDSPPRALGRLVWAAVAKGDTFWKEVSSMQSHLTELGPDDKERLFQLAVSLAHYVGQETINSLVHSSTELLDMCSRFVSNSFSLTAPDLTNIGVCTSPLLALANHSCEPNAVVVFPDFAEPSAQPTPAPRGGPMRLVALRPIEEGEEVLTGYVDLTLPERLRGKELAERYRFECGCGLCHKTRVREGEWVDPREAMACKRRGCAGQMWIPELKLETGGIGVECAACGTITTINAEATESAIDKATTVLSHMERVSPSSATLATLHSTIATLTQSHLAPTSYPLLTLTQLLLTHSIALQHFTSDTAVLATSVLHSLQAVLPAAHPARAIAAAVVVRLRGAGEAGEHNWATREGLLGTREAGIVALKELEGMGGEGVVRREVEGVMKAVEEGLGRWSAQQS